MGITLESIELDSIDVIGIGYWNTGSATELSDEKYHRNFCPSGLKSLFDIILQKKK